MDYVMMCHAHGCLLSLNCKRFTGKPSEQQAYFTDAPYRVVGAKTECEYFWNTKDNEDDKTRKGGIEEIAAGGTEETQQGNGEIL
jgi:hypothetical protein